MKGLGAGRQGIVLTIGYAKVEKSIQSPSILDLRNYFQIARETSKAAAHRMPSIGTGFSPGQTSLLKAAKSKFIVRRAITVFDFVQFSGMQVQEPIGLAFAVGYPEQGKSDVRAVEGHKAKKREKHGVDEQRHVLPTVWAGLLQAVKHNHPDNYHDHQHGSSNLHTTTIQPNQPKRTRSICAGTKLYMNMFPR
jgi:hypothetical protein